MAYFYLTKACMVTLCFLAACDAAATTKRAKTTSISPTTTPSITTTLPRKTTTKPATTPSNGTTQLTTPTMNMTTAPSNTTTASSNATTPTGNMTTPTGNTTPASSNATTPTGNMTTPTGNMTTPYTTAPTTPAPPPVKWQFNDKSGKLCMLMGFNATITYFPKPQSNITTEIPDSANISKSTCGSDRSQFFLEFDSVDMKWQVEMNFTADGDMYKLNRIAVFVYQSTGAQVAFGNDEQDFFYVPVGDYYQCNSFNETTGPFMLNLTSPIFQPFVQKTSTGDVGSSFVCGTILPASKTGSKTTIIIIGAVVGIGVLVAVVAVTYGLMKKRPYARLN